MSFNPFEYFHNSDNAEKIKNDGVSILSNVGRNVGTVISSAAQMEIGRRAVKRLYKSTVGKIPLAKAFIDTPVKQTAAEVVLASVGAISLEAANYYMPKQYGMPARIGSKLLYGAIAVDLVEIINNLNILDFIFGDDVSSLEELGDVSL